MLPCRSRSRKISFFFLGGGGGGYQGLCFVATAGPTRFAELQTARSLSHRSVLLAAFGAGDMRRLLLFGVVVVTGGRDRAEANARDGGVGARSDSV